VTLLALAGVAYVAGGLRAQQQGGAAPAAAEPHTRVAMMNMTYVLKYYKKFDAFSKDIKAGAAEFEGRIKGKQSLIDGEIQKLQKEPNLTAQQKEEGGKRIVAMKRELEDLNNDAKQYITKKSDDQMVQLYREVQDAAQRYAVAHNFDMVLSYNDAPAKEDLNNPINIGQKLSTRACLPLYYTPGMDISYQVVMALNAAYAPSAAAPAAGAAPAAH
jgi:Skp family chaperone for outer membrane proteins